MGVPPLGALKPGLPLLSSLGHQSLVLVSTHRLQLGRLLDPRQSRIPVSRAG